MLNNYLLLTTYYLLLTTYYLLLTTYYLPLTTYHLLLTTYQLQPTFKKNSQSSLRTRQLIIKGIFPNSHLDRFRE